MTERRQWGRPDRPYRLCVVAVTAGALLVGGCGGSDGAASRRASAADPAAPATSPSSAATSPSIPPPAAPAPAPEVPPVSPPPASPPPSPPPVAPGPMPAAGLGPGATGPLVSWAESRLAALHYDVGVLDDRYDTASAAAVMAFQKVQGLPRTGRLTQAAADALVGAQSPVALVPDGGPNRIEIDLAHQVLLLWQAGSLVKVLPVSTGTGKRFCERGHCGVARTPAGSYRIGYRKPGWERSPLGRMYNPMYFIVGPGIAIHGFSQVPPQPASHGCVRIPMFAAETLPRLVPDGTPVYVVDGKTPVRPISAGGPQT